MAARTMARQGCGRSGIPVITRPMCSIPTATMWRSASSPGFTNNVCAAHAPSRCADTPDWCTPVSGLARRRASLPTDAGCVVQLPNSRRSRSWPETGFEEVGRISNNKSASRLKSGDVAWTQEWILTRVRGQRKSRSTKEPLMGMACVPATWVCTRWLACNEYWAE